MTNREKALNEYRLLEDLCRDLDEKMKPLPDRIRSPENDETGPGLKIIVKGLKQATAAVGQAVAALIKDRSPTIEGQR